MGSETRRGITDLILGPIRAKKTDAEWKALVEAMFDTDEPPLFPHGIQPKVPDDTTVPSGDSTPRCKWCRCDLKVGEVTACDECKDYAVELGMTIDEAVQPDPQDGGRLVPRKFEKLIFTQRRIN